MITIQQYFLSVALFVCSLKSDCTDIEWNKEPRPVHQSSASEYNYPENKLIICPPPTCDS